MFGRMKFSTLLVISSIFVLDTTAAPAQDLQRRDAFEEMASKTARPHITGTPDGAIGTDEYGTGFFINGGHIVTAAHVFGESDWKLYNDGRENFPTIDIDQPIAYGLLAPIPNRDSGARLVGQNRAFDLALIQINGIFFLQLSVRKRMWCVSMLCRERREDERSNRLGFQNSRMCR